VVVVRDYIWALGLPVEFLHSLASSMGT